MSEIRSSVSIYLVQSRYRLMLFYSFRDIPSPWPSHMPRNFGCNLTEWAQSIFPSRGRTNPDLDTYASTYTFGIPDVHRYGHPVTVWHLMQSRQPQMILIWYESHSQRIRSLRFLIIATWTSWHDLVAILMLGDIHHDMTSLSRTYETCPMIRKPWSSLAQWTSI